MDCHEALEVLDASTVGAWDGEPDAVQSARRHVAECAQCRSAWPQREQWNRKLAQAMQDVAVPSQLGVRLHALLPQSAPASPARRHSSWSRRAWIVSASTVAVAVAAWMFWPAAPTVRLMDLQSAVDVPLEDLPEFSQSFPPRLPKEWEPFFDLDAKFIRGYPDEGQPQSGRLSLVPFQFSSRPGAVPLRGRLVILRRNQLHPDDVPATGFAAAPIGYLQSGSGGGAWVAWVEDDLVFVCLVPSGPAALHQFQQILTSSRPLS